MKECQLGIPKQKALSSDQQLAILRERELQNKCDGDCDLDPPYKQCSGCQAGSLLNDICDTLNEAKYG